MSEDLMTKRLSPMVIQTPAGPLALMKYDPEGNYLHWSDSGDRSAPPPHSAGVVVSERIEQIDTLLRRAHACLSPPNAEDRDPGGAQMDISEALALVAALGGEGG